jgi:hypothetical protein
MAMHSTLRGSASPEEAFSDDIDTSPFQRSTWANTAKICAGLGAAALASYAAYSYLTFPTATSLMSHVSPTLSSFRCAGATSGVGPSTSPSAGDATQASKGYTLTALEGVGSTLGSLYDRFNWRQVLLLGCDGSRRPEGTTVLSGCGDGDTAASQRYLRKLRDGAVVVGLTTAVAMSLN